jgi:hypothetical protein
MKTQAKMTTNFPIEIALRLEAAPKGHFCAGK